MAVSQELQQVINSFNGINTNDDETITDDNTFLKMDNFYINNSTHELMVRPGFLELGQNQWGSAQFSSGFTYLARIKQSNSNCILGFRYDQDGGSLAYRRDYDGFISNQQSEYPTTAVFGGRITTSASYADKEYFYGPGLAKEITWSIDLAGNDLGGAGVVTADIVIEQASYFSALSMDSSNNPTRLAPGALNLTTTVQTITIPALIIAAGGTNIYKTYTGTLTLDQYCMWTKMSIRITNTGDVVGNKKLRVKNPIIRATNYSTKTNRVPNFNFSNFGNYWGRRVVTASANQRNEIVIAAANLATQTGGIVAEQGDGVIEIYPDVNTTKTFAVASTAIEVCGKPWKYYDTTAGIQLNLKSISAPPFLGVHVFKDRVWGFAEEESRLWYSDIGAPESWPTVNFVDIGETDQNITGLYGFNDKLLIFKDRSIYVLYVTASTTTWNLRKFDGSVGCSSQYTIKRNKGFVYFVGWDGVYRTDGDSIECISDPIANVVQSQYRNIPYPTQKYDHAGFYLDQYVVTFEFYGQFSGSSNNIMYVFNTKFNCWYTWTPPLVFGQARLGFFIDDELQSNWGPGLIACRPLQNYQNNSTNNFPKMSLVVLPISPEVRTDLVHPYADNCVPFVATLTTHQLTYDDLVSWKKVKFVDVVAEGTADVGISQVIDNSDTATTPVVSVLGGQIDTATTKIQSLKIKVNKICKSMRLVTTVTPSGPTPGIFIQFSGVANNYNGFDVVTNTPLTSSTLDIYRPAFEFNQGPRLAPKVGLTAVAYTTPYIPIVPLTALTVAARIYIPTAQAGNTKYISYTFYDSTFVAVGATVVLENNTNIAALAGYSSSTSGAITAPANAVYVRMTFQNNGLGSWFANQVFISSTPTAGKGYTFYSRSKISIYSIALFLHKMRVNIKGLT